MIRPALLLVAALSVAAFSAEPPAASGPKPEPLWVKDVPGVLGDKPADIPTLTIYPAPPETATGAAMLICPGGGYGALMMTYEGEGIARWLNANGITGVVVKYRVKPYRHPIPWNDAKRAIRTVRSRAAELKIDPAKIGVIGFSAGGHLASTLITHYDAGDAAAADPIERANSRPDFAVLVYPVISFDEKTGGGSRTNLLGPTPTDADSEFLSNQKHVTAETPPTFLVHSTKDKMVSVEHSRVFVAALKEKGVRNGYLELTEGDHGLGVGKGALWEQWKTAAMVWIKETVGKK